MLKSKRIQLLAVAATAAILTVAGCKKENGIDNNAVVRTPYTLYFTDYAGSIYNTNTGDSFKTVWAPDGYTERAITTSGENLLMVKLNVHLSRNEGENFNPVDSSARPDVPWQSIILDVQDQGKVYLASIKGQGLKVSIDHGATWNVDTTFDTSITNHYIPKVHSLTQLTNGELYAMDDVNHKLYRKINSSSKWLEVTMNGLPTSGSYFLSRFNTALLATDTSGTNGVWASADGGQNWAQYLGTQNYGLQCTYAAFDQTLLVGTNSQGVYRLQNNFLNPSNAGLDLNTTVYAIASKKDVYKNGQLKQYVFIATSTGLYRSEDIGQNWIKVLPGDFRRAY